MNTDMEMILNCPNNSCKKLMIDILENKVKEIDIKFVSYQELAIIIKLIRNNSSIKKIKIYSSNDVDNMMIEIIRLIDSKPNITDVYINGLASINSSNFTEILEKNTTITKLVLYGTLFLTTGDYLYNLLRAVSKNFTLKQLCIGAITLSHDNIDIISQQIGLNETLERFSLFSSNIDDYGAEAFADMLKNNSTLTHLSLCQNIITDEGIYYISEALTTNNSLKILELSLNHFTSKSVEQLAEKISVNYSIEHVNMCGFKIKETTLNTVCDFLKENYSIKKFDLNNKTDKLTTILDRNSRFSTERRFRKTKSASSYQYI